MLTLALAACAGDAPSAGDTGIPLGFSASVPLRCEAAAGAPTWTEVPGFDTPYAPPTTTGPEDPAPGAVAVVRADGRTWVLWTAPGGDLSGRTIEGDEARDGVATDVRALAAADLDGDGATDLLVVAKAVEVFWGFGTAEEAVTVVVDRGNADGARPSEVGVADFDGDGILDLLAVRSQSDHEDREALAVMRIRGLGGRAFAEPDLVEGPDEAWGIGFDVSVFDVDGDTAPDAIVCNDDGWEVAPNALVRNDGAGGLAVADDALGLEVAGRCMGLAVGDGDLDGDLDVYLGDRGVHHLLAQSDGAWFDVAQTEGLPSFDAERMAWGASLGDVDNDGAPDLVVASGDWWEADMDTFDAWGFSRGADGAWVDRAPDLDLPTSTNTRGVVVRDLDDDGVPDFVFGDATRPPWVLLSGGCTASSWIEVEAPTGSLVRVTAGGVTRAALATVDASWASSGPAVAHFGLGDVEEIESVEVRAPWHETERWCGAPVRTRITWQP